MTSANLLAEGAPLEWPLDPKRSTNGAVGTRTPDLLHAMQAFSQLNYGPAEPLAAASPLIEDGVVRRAGGHCSVEACFGKGWGIQQPLESGSYACLKLRPFLAIVQYDDRFLQG